jgi:signal transduction histidine kinase
MTGGLMLDWVVLAVSLFNTILLLWLGLTVFLNAEARVWGIWLAAGGLLLGAIFFISHTAILGHGLSSATPGLNFWWRIGWIPITVLPLVWYVVMLWYSGFWRQEGISTSGGRLDRRHKPWLYVTLAAGLAWIVFLLIFNPLPDFAHLPTGRLILTPSVGGVPLLVLAYPLYTLLCVLLSLDALRHPEPSGRLMGDLARLRARRWLISVALILLAVGFLVGWVMVWFVRGSHPDLLSLEIVEIVLWFDLAIETLIAAAVVLLGQAVVTYEIFTGSSLPRRGLSQYWRRALVLGAGFSLILAGSLTLQLRPIYSILLSMLLMVVFYALLGWRAFAERERFIQNLRPFVAHQRLFQDILEGDQGRRELDRTASELEDINEPFSALCGDILEARCACLAPFGALAPLSGAPLVYPKGSGISMPDLGELIPHLRSPLELGVALTPDNSSGFVFAVSLWNERGLIGVLLLGEKQSGGLYTQEEIEIARAVGEHLIDTKASIEMARRLISLQRQRLAQSQILDQHTRRVLHDEILPFVHTSILNLDSWAGEQSEHIPELISQLEEIHRQLSSLLRSTSSTLAVEVHQLGFMGAVRKTIEVDLRGSFDDVHWEIQPQGEQQLTGIPVLIAEVLFFAVREALRNAARHGRRNGARNRFCLAIALKVQNGLVITIEDNGAGFAIGEPFVIDESSGQGLALHSTMMAVIGGLLTVESVPGQYTRVSIELPEIAWQNWE